MKLANFKFEPLNGHAGSIQSSISLELEGTQDYSTIGIFPGMIISISAQD